MTKPNFTSINVVLDKSGSMYGLRTDTIGGLNSFIKEQKAAEGEAIFTLAVFNHDFELIHDCIKLEDVKELTSEDYVPCGNTALLDAIGKTIVDVGKKLAAMTEKYRPSKVIVVIITDGQENFSREFSKKNIQSMINHQRNKYSWEFVFLGVDEASIKDAHLYGFTTSNTTTYNHDSAGVRDMISNISDNMKSYRGGTSSNVDFFNQNKK